AFHVTGVQTCALPISVEQGLRRILAVCHEYGIQAIIRTVVLCPRRDEGRVCLTVSINQQYTGIGSASASQHSCDTERGIGGGCRFADTPFVIRKNENASHCSFLSIQQTG